MYQAKLIKADTIPEAAEQIRKIDVGEECVRIMKDKAVFRLVKLHDVRNAVANIIKQEMISCGGDATVSQWTVNCTHPKTDVLLMGTIKQYKLLIAKMRMQGAYRPNEEKKKEYKAVCDELSEILKDDLKPKD
ncbi:MAG: hypothetical protein N3F07_00920 [Candidatus Micrarchaeota archaeon]|nr:hypothetical protein [Candidatus Micrarchaeota archaeon]